MFAQTPIGINGYYILADHYAIAHINGRDGVNANARLFAHSKQLLVAVQYRIMQIEDEAHEHAMGRYNNNKPAGYDKTRAEYLESNPEYQPLKELVESILEP